MMFMARRRTSMAFNLTLATVFFAYQIYCDFSGYSDIAIGAARVLGFKLMENFRTPYYSRSISEFWQRWHISLSTWFRDYVYIPLGGEPGTRSRMVLEHSDHVHGQWSLARRQLDLCCVGPAERRLSAGKHGHQRVA